MFPEAFAEYWIERLTAEGDVVFDPFCGRGTAPFQALLMGRNAFANDINPVAYCVTKAKTKSPSLPGLRRRLTSLRDRYQASDWESERRQLPLFFRHAFSPETLRQLLFLRTTLKWQSLDSDCMLAAIALGALHGGGSPSYFSNQMPRTISTKPAYSVKFWQERNLRPPKRDVFQGIGKLTDFRYASQPPANHATVLNCDMREIPSRRRADSPPIRLAITSPPYFNTTNYEEDQWLRLWFLGGLPHPTYRTISLDDRHENEQQYWSMISDMWRVFGDVMQPNSDLVIRLAFKGKASKRLVESLEATGIAAGRHIRLVEWQESEIKRRQTNAFRPGSAGVLTEVDCHFTMV